jgi:hypothetical protein
VLGFVGLVLYVICFGRAAKTLEKTRKTEENSSFVKNECLRRICSWSHLKPFRTLANHLEKFVGRGREKGIALLLEVHPFDLPHATLPPNNSKR